MVPLGACKILTYTRVEVDDARVKCGVVMCPRWKRAWQEVGKDKVNVLSKGKPMTWERVD